MATKLKTIKDKNLKVELIPAVVSWRSRYSNSMDDDKQGRWGMVAYAGDEKIFARNGGKNVVCHWEIAWIHKLKDDNGVFLNRFTVRPSFPNNCKGSYDTLEEAQREIEKSFKWFIKNCVGGFKIKQKIKI